MVFKNYYITELRKLKKVSQQELADALGISQPHVSRFEAGVMVPTIEQLLRIVEFFGVDIGEFFDGEKSTISVPEPSFMRSGDAGQDARKLIDHLYKVIDDQRTLINYYRSIIDAKEE